jgi:predicted SnoaL-like aldol condensation-catalyzing enzyme
LPVVNVEANKALVRRFYEEVWHRGNVRFAEEVFADDYVRHDLRPTTAEPGGPGQALIAKQFRRAFPDLEWRVDLLLGEGDSSPRAGPPRAHTRGPGGMSHRPEST